MIYIASMSRTILKGISKSIPSPQKEEQDMQTLEETVVMVVYFPMSFSFYLWEHHLWNKMKPEKIKPYKE